jgi:serine phosphatase RsbU (regulator of sigma subunit)
MPMQLAAEIVWDLLPSLTFATPDVMFVTAALSELDTDRGVFRKISAGHPGELLLRDGKLVKVLSSPTAMPLGWATSA